ncbi:MULTISPECIES: hypothetical protein [Salipiger]|jgi:cytochrome c oxidase assembly factor CtaG|nr:MULTISPECIES: hypothetical protein [Salipiger]GFZ97468.1 hypothetical protein GCM10011326_06040 [Salipiger profundus]SFD00562.1 hypothetical protein SAMN05444415_106250 [Salipiger profundus]
MTLFMVGLSIGLLITAPLIILALVAGVSSRRTARRDAPAASAAVLPFAPVRGRA